MHKLLSNLLGKRKVTREQLTPEEREDFVRWESVLQGRELNIDLIKEFCRAQMDLIEGQWRNFDNEARKNERLIALHVAYKAILKLIESPAVEREELEKYLTELITKA